MSDRMIPISFDNLLRWITMEYSREDSIFGIPGHMFFRKKDNSGVRIFSDFIDTAVGPAAGPHTQLSQNIVAAFLTGGRFIELKTVQKLDSLEIDKPCIDARDEGYNTEWSTELSLEQAYDEYVKAWFLLHFLAAFLDLPPNFMFNMSIGYDLEGIKTEGMDRFIDGLIDATKRENFSAHMESLKGYIESLFKGSGDFSRGLSPETAERLESLPGKISPKIVNSVTLSTMHGCPPDEIESICSYLMEEKKLNTYVKLNPTLLGYERVREILNKNGYHYVELKEESFLKDLQYGDAVHILGNLEKKAKAEGVSFGLKLSNTLGTVNPGKHLPGEEMYMSGRALFPLTINLAALLSREFDGRLPISYSGGASQLNVESLLDVGIKPITFATELLKPGGYLRLKEAAELLEGKYEKALAAESINVDSLERLAEDSVGNLLYSKGWRGEDTVSVKGELPITDCYVAPCREACPVGQDIPQYIQAAGSGDFDASLSIIRATNALPGVTGYICEQPCTTNCTRLDYDSPVFIRDVKLSGFLKGDVSGKDIAGESGKLNGKVAVVGAGPAGLACAYYLALAGADVTVFDKRDSAGGVVNHILPRYRLPEEAVKRDIEEIEKAGVVFEFGVSPSPEELKEKGYKCIFLGIGAEVSRHLKGIEVAEGEERVTDALSFLDSYRRDPASLKPGRRVAVIGGGNTAMDAARSARRLDGVEEVTVYYRRSEREMPADREEYENAKEDGVVFRFLRAPVSVKKDKVSGRLVVTLEKMKLGKPDESGRRKPIGTCETEDVQVDMLIEAIGEGVDTRLLEEWGLELDSSGRPVVKEESLETSMEGVYIGGDAYRGPSSVVEAMGDGRKAADSILRRLGLAGGLDETGTGKFRLSTLSGLKVEFNADSSRVKDIYSRKGKIYNPDELASYAKEPGSEGEAGSEAERCLECDFLCNKCVDVCPNRANVPILVKSDVLKDYYQIVHVDALCNECGNCGTFCPWEGVPYKDKLTLFHRYEDFESSSNDGFVLLDGDRLELRVNGKTRKIEVKNGHALERGEALASYFGVPGSELGGITDIVESLLDRYRYLFEL